ncbi:MAG: class I SAM-dependent methyltransferase [Opitutales bacterium]
MSQLNPIEHNRRAWDRRAREGDRFATPVHKDELSRSRPAIDMDGWLPDNLHGSRVLCLGAGGGRHGPLYAAAGAKVTVVDVSAQQLEWDRQIAGKYGYDLHTLDTSMDDLSVLSEEGFDIVVQPVSTCYLPDIRKVYREVARVTQPGGLYISQHKQPMNLQAHVHSSPRGYELIEPYYRTGPLPEVIGSPHREPGTVEYLHRWDELVGEMCRSGFAIEDLNEPRHADNNARSGSFDDRSRFIPPYVRLKARRIEKFPARETRRLVLR